MKRSEVIDKIAKAAKARGVSFVVEREGGNHTLYNVGGVRVPIGRHPSADFGSRPTRDAFKHCEAVLGKGWWR